jgi:hypothetical protein
MTTASTSMAAAPYQELATAPGRMAGTPRRTDLPVRLLADGQLAHQEQRTYRRFTRLQGLRSVATVALPGVHLTGTGRGRSGWAWTPGLPQYRELTAAACCQAVLAVAHLLSSRRRSCFLATPIVAGLWPPGRERTP